MTDLLLRAEVALEGRLEWYGGGGGILGRFLSGQGWTGGH